MKALLYGFLLARFRLNQLKLLAAFLLFALLLWGCDMDGVFRAAEKTKRDLEAHELHVQRSKDFGKATPVEVINPFSSQKVILK